MLLLSSVRGPAVLTRLHLPCSFLLGRAVFALSDVRYALRDPGHQAVQGLGQADLATQARSKTQKNKTRCNMIGTSMTMGVILSLDACVLIYKSSFGAMTCHMDKSGTPVFSGVILRRDLGDTAPQSSSDGEGLSQCLLLCPPR